MRKNKWNRRIAFFSLAGMCVTAATGVLAAWQVSGSTVNTITTAVFQNKIVERYTEPEHVDPAEEVSKEVNIRNTGSVASCVRVSLIRSFGEVQEDGTFVADPSLDSEKIRLNLNRNLWVEQDGYYYYREVLYPGKTTREPLLTSFQIDPDAGNEYMGKTARITVLLDSVQADTESFSLWKTDEEKLQIQIPDTSTVQDTKVTYYGKEKGFDITLSQADLFANFKNLLPGCSRSQTIHIKNASAQSAEIFLHAEAASQDSMTAAQQSALLRLLEEYAQIEIRDGDRLLYQGPVSGNLDAKTGTMRNDLSLGTFEAGETRELSVSLSVSTDLDTEDMGLTGKVKWVFRTEGDDSEPTDIPQTDSIYPAKTGVMDLAAWCCSGFVLCLAIAIFSLLNLYREKKQNERNDRHHGL